MKIIFSEKNDLDSNVENLKKWFRKTGYPEQLIRTKSLVHFSVQVMTVIIIARMKKRLVFHYLPPITQDSEILVA